MSLTESKNLSESHPCFSNVDSLYGIRLRAVVVVVVVVVLFYKRFLKIYSNKINR